MYRYSKISRKRLDTCDIDLQRLFKKVLESKDHSIICGYRGPRQQNEAFQSKKSKVKYPNSKHNPYPSKAVDAGPYPIDWNDIPRWYEFGEFVVATAKEMKIEIRWGGDWDMDGDYTDQTFNDLGHFELVG